MPRNYDEPPPSQGFDALLSEVYELAEIVLGDPHRHDELARARARRKLAALLRSLDVAGRET